MSAGPIVIKIGGAGVDDPFKTRELWQAIAEAHAILHGKLVLVHGGGRAVDAHLDRLGLTTTRIEGLRVTPDDQIDEIVAVLAGRVNKNLVAAIQASTASGPATVKPVQAVGLCLGDGLLVPATKKLLAAGDLGRVGEIELGTGGSSSCAHDPRLLRLLMEHAFLPVLCSIGFDEHGRTLNLNADDAAAGVARLIGATRLVLLTDVPGVLDASKTLIPRLDDGQIASLIASGVITGGMIPKVRAALDASRASGAPTVIASWQRPQDLTRLARGESAGTEITARP